MKAAAIYSNVSKHKTFYELLLLTVVMHLCSDDTGIRGRGVRGILILYLAKNSFILY